MAYSSISGLWNSIRSSEFAKSRAHACHACQRGLRSNVPKACQHAKGVLSTIFQKKKIFNIQIFQLWLAFANFKDIWAIPENSSRETKNLNFDICLFLLTCYKSCFSYLSCTP